MSDLINNIYVFWLHCESGGEAVESGEVLWTIRIRCLGNRVSSKDVANREQEMWRVQQWSCALFGLVSCSFSVMWMESKRTSREKSPIKYWKSASLILFSALGIKSQLRALGLPSCFAAKCFSRHSNYALCDCHRFCVVCSFAQTSAFQTPATFLRKLAPERSPQTTPAVLFSGRRRLLSPAVRNHQGWWKRFFFLT